MSPFFVLIIRKRFFNHPLVCITCCLVTPFFNQTKIFNTREYPYFLKLFWTIKVINSILEIALLATFVNVNKKILLSVKRPIGFFRDNKNFRD